MEEFLNNLYSYEYFGFYLIVSIIVLVLLFIIILFFGKKDQKVREIEATKKLQNGNMKDENTLREVIDTLSKMTGKKVSKEQSDKIISKVVEGNVPNNIDKMF